MNKNYDLVVLGGGMGGYVAALRASQLGLKTAIVEKDKIGGTCLHRGCIPSKALLKSAQIYQLTKNALDYGIEVENVRFNFNKVRSEKDYVVHELHKGLLHLINKGKIDIYEGKGRILGPSIFSPLPGAISVEMNDKDDHEILIPKNLIIATGSKPRNFDQLPFDGERILSSDDALQLGKLPKSIIIVGGGAIGIEWASMLTDFGVEVTILEAASQLLPLEDDDISKAVTSHFEKKGITVETNVIIHSHKVDAENICVNIESENRQGQATAEKLLVCVGREAITQDIGLENTEINLENQYIKTNHFYQTAESHIYAVGDCIGGVQLAHVAAREGLIAVEHIAGLNPNPLDPTQIVQCVYSNPEVASIGMTEKEARAKNYEIKVGKFPFKANGKALLNKESDGFVKIISNALTDDLLGVHMFGYNVTELISEAALAKVLDATPWEISQTIHPHPSMSEVIGEAALSVDGIQLHF